MDLIDFVEKIHEIAHQESTEEQKQLIDAFDRYQKKFGNTNFTSMATYGDEDLIEKINNSIKLGIEFDDLYVGDISDDDLI